MEASLTLLSCGLSRLVWFFVHYHFQIEPFFLRIFLYDCRAGHRLSEEFRIDPNSAELIAKLKIGGKNGTVKNFVDKSTLEEDGVNILSQRMLADKNVRKVILIKIRKFVNENLFVSFSLIFYCLYCKHILSIFLFSPAAFNAACHFFFG